MTINQTIEVGRAALRTGRWEEAFAAFEASLAEKETPEALDGMGEALWWLCEARSSERGPGIPAGNLPPPARSL